MRKTFATMALAALLSAACTESRQQKRSAGEEPEEEPLPERFENDDLPRAADELFEDFLYYFASNERLQRRRIAFPLTCSEGGQDTLINEQQWTMDTLFMGSGEYAMILDSREQREIANDSALSKVTLEQIIFASNQMKSYHFCREDGRWMLTDIALTPLNVTANAEFLDFYHNFATDSLFQQNSLSKEIMFSGPDPDDDFAQMEGFIDSNSWEAFAPELPSDTLFNLVFTKQDSRSRKKIMLFCGISNGQEMEMTFARKRNGWKLEELIE